MKKEMRTQIYRMLGIFSLLLVMVAWQFDFVLNAINASAFLNLSIIGFFLFGIFLLYLSLKDMPNEIVAFESLKEFHSDILASKSGIELDPLWKFQRCEKPPHIFRKPVLLGQSYQMVYEEMARTNQLKINATTVQTLVDNIDIRLSEQRSMMQYITGLLVFMGLIGTFVGLMSTLASVGDIIGGLDLSNGAGIEVIQTLMTNLQKPLVGMATGFSSSLFGLVTSLTLGLMSRFGAKHNDVLRSHFEAWLASAAQLEKDNEFDEYTVNGKVAKGGNASGAAFDEDGLDHRELRLLYRVAKNSVDANRQINERLKHLANSIEQIEKQQNMGKKELADFAMHVANISSQQKEFGYLLEKAADGFALQSETNRHMKQIDQSFNQKMNELQSSNQHLQLQLTDQLRMFDGKLEQKFDEVAEKTESVKAAFGDEVTKIDHKMHNNFGVMHNNLGRLDRLHAEQMTELKGIIAKSYHELASINGNVDLENNDEYTQIMNQLDNLIKVKQLSRDDMKELKSMSRIFVENKEEENHPNSIRDLFNRIIDTYGEMEEKPANDDQNEVEHQQPVNG